MEKNEGEYSPPMKQHSRVLYLPTKSYRFGVSPPMSNLDWIHGDWWFLVALDHLSIHLEEPNMFEKTTTLQLLKRY